MLGLIIGVLIGSFIAVVTMSLMAMANEYEPSKQEKHENKNLWTAGNSCKWEDKIFEIKRFSTTSDNQTVVQLIRNNPEHNYCIWVPIEELEEVME